jgi:hypothetical protein
MPRSIDDIDEDDDVAPAPIVINTNAKPGNASVMDDLFGPSSSSVPAASSSSSTAANNNNNITASNNNNNSQSSPNNALDDFFGGAPTTSTQHKNNNNSHMNKKDDVFDALFSAGPSNNSNNQQQQHYHHSQNSQPGSSNAVSGGVKSAIDHLEAFSSVSKGGAAPWMQTKSVNESKTISIFADDGVGAGIEERIFVPPDQVLSLMTLYDVIGAAPNWAVEDIAKAYKKKALLLHPDKLPGKKRNDREERYFKIITAAYEVLKDKDRRAEYDAALKRGEGGAQSSWLNFVS